MLDDGWMGCETRADDAIRHLPSFALSPQPSSRAFLTTIPTAVLRPSIRFRAACTNPLLQHFAYLLAFFRLDMYWSAYSNFTFRNSSFIDGHTVAGSILKKEKSDTGNSLTGPTDRLTGRMTLIPFLRLNAVLMIFFDFLVFFFDFLIFLFFLLFSVLHDNPKAREHRAWSEERISYNAEEPFQSVSLLSFLSA